MAIGAFHFRAYLSWLIVLLEAMQICERLIGDSASSSKKSLKVSVKVSDQHCKLTRVENTLVKIAFSKLHPILQMSFPPIHNISVMKHETRRDSAPL